MRRPFMLAFVVLVLLGGLGPAAAEERTALELLREARLHAGTDQHPAAIDDYERAFSLDPSLADAHAHELGYQLTWAGRSAEAVPWFERRLAAAPDDRDARLGLARALSWTDRTIEAQQEYEQLLVSDPSDLEARRGRALMLAWQDRLEEARAAYEEILEDHPDDLETRRQHAQVVNWTGAHGEAVLLYEEILQEHPRDSSSRMGLVQALRWGGREREALRAIDPIRREGPASSLYHDLKQSVAPVATIENGWSSDSDDLIIVDSRGTWESYTIAEVRTRFSLRHMRLTQEGQPDLDAWGVGVGGARYLSPRSSVNAYVDVLHFRSEGPVVNAPGTENLSYTLWGFDAWWAWRPHRTLSVYLSTDRSFLDTVRSLGHEIAVTTVGASADWRLGSGWTLSGLLRRSHYSDGNRRALGSVALMNEWGEGWRMRGGAQITAFGFRETVDRGYWNPESFQSYALLGSITDRRPERRWHPRLELRVARERDDGPSYGVFAWTLGAEVELGRGWSLDVAGGSSDSRLSSGGGYERDWARAAIRLRY